MIFKILCEKGDAPYDYDVETAQIKFDELTGSGLLPMKVTDKGHVPMKKCRNARHGEFKW